MSAHNLHLRRPLQVYAGEEDRNNTPQARQLLQIDMDAYASWVQEFKAQHNQTAAVSETVSETETGIAMMTLLSFILLMYLWILVRGLREQFARPKRSSVASRETDTLWNVFL